MKAGTKIFSGLSVRDDATIISDKKSPDLSNCLINDPIGALSSMKGIEKYNSVGYGNPIVAIHQLNGHIFSLSGSKLYEGYPLKIYGEDDSYVNIQAPDTNYGDTYDLNTYYHHTGGRKNFFIKKPPEATTLHIYLYGWGYYSSPSLGVYTVSSSWSEETITWNNQPSKSFIKSVTPTLGWMTFDLSSHINYASFCFAISVNRWGWLGFSSKENSDTTKRPYWS